MASPLFFCISVGLVVSFIIDQSHGLRVIRPQMSRIRRPQSPGHRLNPLTRTFVVDNAGAASDFGHQFRRRSFRDDDDDDDLQAGYFRFLLGDPAAAAVERKRRSLPSGGHFVPDYDESMIQGDREWRTKRREVQFAATKPDYWDFINAGNAIRKKAEVAAEDRRNLDRKKTVVDGEGLESPVEEEDLQPIRMHGFDHGSAYNRM